MIRAEYVCLVKDAERNENQRLFLAVQTICAMGIWVSELCFITVESVQTGRAEVSNKGKCHTVFLPDKLRRLLRAYLQKQKITVGAVFVSKNRKPLDQSNISAAEEGTAGKIAEFIEQKFLKSGSKSPLQRGNQ